MTTDELFSPEIAELESFIDSYVSDRAMTAALMHSPPKQSGFSSRSLSSESKNSQLDRLSSTESRGSHSSATRNSSKESDFLTAFQDELLLHQRDQNLNYEHKLDPAFVSMQYSDQNYVPSNPNYSNAASTSAQELAMQLRAVRQNYENEIRPHVQIQENRGLNEIYQEQQMQGPVPTQFQQPLQWDQGQLYYQMMDPQVQQQPMNGGMPMWNNTQATEPYNPQLQQFVSGGLQQMYPEATTFATAGPANMQMINGGIHPQHQGLLQHQNHLPEWVDVSVPPPSWNQQQMYTSNADSSLQQVPIQTAPNQGVYIPKPKQISLNEDNIDKAVNSKMPNDNPSKTPQANMTPKTKSQVSSKSSLNPELSPNNGGFQSRTFKRSTSSTSSNSNNPRKTSSGKYSEADKDDNWRETCKQNCRKSSANTDGSTSEKDDSNVSVFSDKSDKSPKHKQGHKKANNRTSNASTASNDSKSTTSSNPKTISARSKADIKNILGGKTSGGRNRSLDNSSINEAFQGMKLESDAELKKFIATAQAYSTNESKMREMAEIVCNKAIQNPLFGRKAALLCKRMSSYMTQGTKFRSVVLNIMQGHYRNCQQLLNMMISSNGKDIRLLGYITFLAEFFFNVSTKNGAHLKVLTDPLYGCLKLLITSPHFNRHMADCFTCNLELTGKLLERYNSEKMSDLMSEVRNQCIISPALTKPIRSELLRIIEVYASNWSKLGSSANDFYDKTDFGNNPVVSNVKEKKQPKSKKQQKHNNNNVALTQKKVES